MKITVNEQVQRFYLATNKRWVPAVGHEIKVGKYSFSAIPVNGKINVSEVTTGMKFFDIPLTPEVMEFTEFKEGAFIFFHEIGESLKKRLMKIDDFDAVLSLMNRSVIDRLGERPPIANEDWQLVKQSDTLH